MENDSVKAIVYKETIVSAFSVLSALSTKFTWPSYANTEQCVQHFL